MMCTLKDTLGGGEEGEVQGEGEETTMGETVVEKGAVRRAGRVPDVQLPSSAAAAALPTAGP